VIDRLQVVGPVGGAAGYDRHTREFVQAFVRLGVAVQLTPVRGWSQEPPPGSDVAWAGELGDPVGADTVLHFQMPHQVRPRPGMRNVNYTMFEASRIPRDWSTLAYLNDLVVLPTGAAREAWRGSGVEEGRLRVAPLGVDAGFFSTPSLPLRLASPDGRDVGERRVRFLTVAELRPRKNLVGLLRAWIRATRPGDDAVLIVKASAFQPGLLDQFAADVQAMQRELGRSLADAAAVLLLPALLSERQLLALYNTATHYVSLSHGEGWDMPMVEAALAGLELIAPRHTSYVEYLREDEVVFVPASLVPVAFEGRHGAEDEALFGGLSWWEPDEDAAVEIIRRTIDDGTTGKRSPAARLASEYPWERSARRLLEALDEAA
jgi:glycosyltransferase involved in cell wall biosynthesis